MLPSSTARIEQVLLINQPIVGRALFIEDEREGQGRLSLETAKLSGAFAS